MTAVRIWGLLRGSTYKLAVVEPTYPGQDGTRVIATDSRRRLHEAFALTVGLRNRLP